MLILRAGGFDVQLSRLYPKLTFVVQDRGPVLEQGEHTVWPKENPLALADGRITFMEHDFFNVNPVKDADVYWLRYIMSVTSYSELLLLLPFVPIIPSSLDVQSHHKPYVLCL